jgi:hypothetical protein
MNMIQYPHLLTELVTSIVFMHFDRIQEDLTLPLAFCLHLMLAFGDIRRFADLVCLSDWTRELRVCPASCIQAKAAS